MLGKLFEQRQKKAGIHARAWAYYDSEAKPRWLNQALNDFFKDNQNYIQNWIAVIVDAVTDRMLVDGFAVGENEPAEIAINERWDTLRLDQHACQIHQDVMVTGEGFMLYEIDDEDNTIISRQDPACMAALYEDGADPEKLTAAAKFYVEDKRRKCIVWTKDTISRYVFTDEKNAPKTAVAYRLESEETNAFGAIPVFHFRRTMRRISPDFAQVIPLQDSLNKAFILLGVATEISACKVRWIAGNDGNDIPALMPGDTIQIPEGAQIGQLEGDQLTQYLTVVDSISLAMASISRTPRHFFAAQEGGVPSGEALQAMESPLIRKVEGYQSRFAPTWAALMAFDAQQSGTPVDVQDVTVTWRNPRTTLIISQANARAANVQAGIPILTQLRDEGWRQNELDQLLEDRNTETPVELDEAAIEQVYDRISQKTERVLEPMLEQALTFIADAALAKIAEGDNLQRLAATQAQATSE